MTVAESIGKLGLGKGKLGSSKSEERGEDKNDGNGNGNNGGNGKPRVAKKKLKRKRGKLKCFPYDGPHMLKKFPKKSALKKKLVDKAVGLGSSGRGVKAKEAESEKKPVECFLCHDNEPKKPCSSKGNAEAKRAKRNKSVTKGNDGVDKEPKKLGSSKGKAEAKMAKRSKKKRVKCFLFRGPHELRNCPKYVVAKGKAMSEHGDSSEGLLGKKEVSFSSNLEEEVAIKIVNLEPMRLNSSEASELAESSIRLAPMGEVGGASDFKEKKVIRRGRFEVLEQGG
ncbi:Regulatory E2 [Gossypium arboreum]|uniref:Regulatory E2 n=1 Tax=Gossypium arboreum TaxID=29729 RepID=A0A0B0NFR4_GOSAR|nr:Regulatory E2 [Gossypium arboreum]